MDYGCPAPVLHFLQRETQILLPALIDEVDGAIGSGARDLRWNGVDHKLQAFVQCLHLAERLAQPGHQTADDQSGCEEGDHCYLVDRVGNPYAEKWRDKEVVHAQKGHDGDKRGRNEVSAQRNEQNHDQAEEGGRGEIDLEPITAVGQQQDGGAAKQRLHD
jgi:hypothetical protein